MPKFIFAYHGGGMPEESAESHEDGWTSTFRKLAALLDA